MPNSQAIHQTLPNFSATKIPSAAPELKANNNNFNQVLKNEVVSKTKKNNTESHNTLNAQNTKSHTTPNSTSKTEIQEENKNDISDKEEPIPNNLSDPGSLLAFVNTVSELAPSKKEDTTDNSSNLTLADLEQPANSTPLSAPVYDNSEDISTKELMPTEQLGVLATQKNSTLKEPQENKTSSISKEDISSRLDTRDLSTVTRQVASKDVINSASMSAPMSASNTKERKGASELLQSPPLDPSSEKNSIFTNVEITQTPKELAVSTASDRERSAKDLNALSKNSTAAQQTIEITQTSQDLSITTASDGEKFAKDLNAQLTQEKQDTLKSIKSESQNEFSLNANKPEFLNAAPAIPAPLATIGNSTISEHISPRVGSKGWDQAIGQKIVWMVAGGEQSAQLSLNPPDLGPVQVVLNISDNFVDASFVSSHLDVREAIEAAAPKLREMMDNAGISLSGFSVSPESTQSGNPFHSEKSQHNGSSKLRDTSTISENNSNSLKSSTTVQNSNQALGLVDTFA